MYTLEVTLLDFYTMLPMLILAVGGMALMLIDLMLKPQHKHYGAWLAVVAFAAAGAASWALLGQSGTAFSGMLVVDSYAQVLGLVAIGAAC
jgi:NADH:ubiquinone oxidoreductase subunit 2 (subunit N)